MIENGIFCARKHPKSGPCRVNLLSTSFYGFWSCPYNIQYTNTISSSNANSKRVYNINKNGQIQFLAQILFCTWYFDLILLCINNYISYILYLYNYININIYIYIYYFYYILYTIISGTIPINWDRSWFLIPGLSFMSFASSVTASAIRSLPAFDAFDARGSGTTCKSCLVKQYGS